MNIEMKEFMTDAFSDLSHSDVQECLILTLMADGKVNADLKCTPEGFQLMIEGLTQEYQKYVEGLEGENVNES